MPELVLPVPRRACEGNRRPSLSIPRFAKPLPMRGVERGSVAIVQLGRYGDLINILPIALHIHNTYRKPYLVVSREFASVLDGVSYVRPVVVDIPNACIHEAMAWARANFEHVIQSQIWGIGYQQPRLTEGYNAESWRMAGLLRRFHDASLVPVWDRANPTIGEQALKFCRKTKKPIILTNLTSGHSSPFEAGPEILAAIQEEWSGRYEVIEVGGLKLHRIYDLVPWIDAARAVVSIDTALLHLAVGRNRPVVALVNPAPWSGTIARVPMERLHYRWCNAYTVNALIRAQLRTRPGARRLPLIEEPCSPPARKFFHAISYYEPKDPIEQKRRQFARESWKRLYEDGLIPVYLTDPLPRALSHYGVKPTLPYLKDILTPAMAMASDDDIIIYSNDDIAFHPDLLRQLQFFCGVYGCTASRRVECSPNLSVPTLDQTPAQWIEIGDRSGIPHLGRDTFAMTKRFLRSIWEELPDFVIGATDWDNCLITMIRRECGYKTDVPSLKKLIWPAEMPRGWTAHVYHESNWNTSFNFWHSPANQHNRTLFRKWAEKKAPELEFDSKNLLIS